MTILPHYYQVNATAGPEGEVPLQVEGLPTLITQAPAEFGGPGDQWSPEDMLVGAVADCYVLTFRAIAKMSGVKWTNIHCQAKGKLDRPERKMAFTGIELLVVLEIPAGTDQVKAAAVLDKADPNCLINNSLNCKVSLEYKIKVV